MTREKIIGNWCRKCNALMIPERGDCKCTAHMDAKQEIHHRARYWLPAFVRLNVSMESANRG